MGYYACGIGEIELRVNTILNYDDKSNSWIERPISIFELEKAVQNIIKKYTDDIADIELYSDKEGNFYIEISDSTGHWSEEPILGFLEELAPYTANGCIDYSGDEDCIWRYIYDPESKSWKEENAAICYDCKSFSDDELIKELESRGYTVEKK